MSIPVIFEVLAKADEILSTDVTSSALEDRTLAEDDASSAKDDWALAEDGEASALVDEASSRRKTGKL